MGLKTTNYEVKKIGMTLPNAYAVVNKLTVDGTRGQAEFNIQTSREAALTLAPIDKVVIQFTVERDKNPLAQAYEASKAVRTERRWVIDEETGRSLPKEVEIKQPFYGWQDDIQ